MIKVFVYGSLKVGGFLHQEEMIEEVTKDTLSNYSIFIHPEVPFPFLLPDEEGTAHGEVHTLRYQYYIEYMDRVEQEGRMYKRIEVTTDSGEEVYVYLFMNEALKPLLTKIEGEWSG